jgi:hypothetical protein
MFLSFRPGLRRRLVVRGEGFDVGERPRPTAQRAPKPQHWRKRDNRTGRIQRAERDEGDRPTRRVASIRVLVG